MKAGFAKPFLWGGEVVELVAVRFVRILRIEGFERAVVIEENDISMVDEDRGGAYGLVGEASVVEV